MGYPSIGERKRHISQNREARSVHSFSVPGQHEMIQPKLYVGAVDASCDQTTRSRTGSADISQQRHHSQQNRSRSSQTVRPQNASPAQLPLPYSQIARQGYLHIHILKQSADITVQGRVQQNLAVSPRTSVRQLQ